MTQSPETSKSRFTPGQVLTGKYEVIPLIGSGGISQVFCVKQTFLNKFLAIKVLDLTHSLDDVQVRRFQVEAPGNPNRSGRYPVAA